VRAALPAGRRGKDRRSHPDRRPGPEGGAPPDGINEGLRQGCFIPGRNPSGDVFFWKIMPDKESTFPAEGAGKSFQGMKTISALNNQLFSVWF